MAPDRRHGRVWRVSSGRALLFLCWLLSVQCSEAREPAPPSDAPASATAQALFAAARSDVLKIRTLLKSGRAQTSVGSGFLLEDSNLLLTNYHVVSRLVMWPDDYEGEYETADGEKGEFRIVAFALAQDLAVLRLDRKGSGFFRLPSAPAPLAQLQQGETIYSMGNPLDLGFAITEGTYNGTSQRFFKDLVRFSGAVSPGMSGGPGVNARGELIGVNVSSMNKGELNAFLVPVREAQALVTRVRAQDPTVHPSAEDFDADITRQLLAYQDRLMEDLAPENLGARALGPYLVPVRESEKTRCVGSALAKPNAPYADDELACDLEAAVTVSRKLQTGSVDIYHELLTNKSLGRAQFMRLRSDSFGNFRTHDSRAGVGPAVCDEDFVHNGHLPLRSVVCAQAYHRFKGLYDIHLLVAAVDEDRHSLQSRYSFYGVSYENGMQLAQRFLERIRRRSDP